MNTTRTTMSAVQLDVLYLSVIGIHRRAIAEELRLRLRAVDQRTAEIKRLLGAADRFGIGVAAIRQRAIDPAYVVAHAGLRRPGPDWVMPTSRQHEILRLRAAGVPASEVAAKVGTVTRAVHQHLARLATGNGARGSANAGALFEALQWI